MSIIKSFIETLKLVIIILSFDLILYMCKKKKNKNHNKMTGQSKCIKYISVLNEHLVLCLNYYINVKKY